MRWLLKSMNGTSPGAETLRRYPLAWRILGCVFERIPLFPLAKSLVDRRFFNVLQQTVTDISTPSTEGTASPGKRKRSSPPVSSVESLRTPKSCIESGQAVFAALRSLLRRADDTVVVAARDKTGAEHLKLILGTSAAEAVSLIAPLLRVCGLLLLEGVWDDIEDCERWVDDIKSLWTLHLQGDDDTSEIAKHVFGPVAVLIHMLEGPQKVEHLGIPDALRERWRGGLQNLMHHSLIFPARSVFLSRGDIGPLFKALTGLHPSPELSSDLPKTAPALYLLASSATEALVQSGIRKGNAEWMKQVFTQVEEAMKARDDRMAIMNDILQQARKRGMPVDTESLQSVCKDYGLLEHSTNWLLIANLSQCDPDVFHKGDTGATLLGEVCDRSFSDSVAKSDYDNITEVLSAVVRGFRSARDFPAFLRLWYQRLAQIEKREAGAVPSWQSLGSEVHPYVEQSLSIRQLTELLEWVGDQKLRPEALCLWLSAMCDGLSSAAYQDATGQRIFDLALNVKKSSSAHTALKWRIIGKAIQWAPDLGEEKGAKEDKLDENWLKIEDSIKKILKKGVIKSPETFEAFKCVSALWIHVFPDGSLVKETGKLVTKFDERLAAEHAAMDAWNTALSTQSLDDILSEADNISEKDILHYLAWYLRGSTRLHRFVFEKSGELPQLMRSVLLETSVFSKAVQAVWNSLLDNEQSLNNGKLGEQVIDRLVKTLQDSRKSSGWLNDGGKDLLRLLSRVPLDVISRPQREQLVAILVDAATSHDEGRKAPVHAWRAILSLITRLMSRPVFYEGMSFDHLIAIAESAAGAIVSANIGHEALIELMKRYESLSCATIRQMASNTDETNLNYFKGAQRFVDDALAGKEMSRLYPTLLKALSAELSESKLLEIDQPKRLHRKSQQAIEDSLQAIFETWTSDKKLWAKQDDGQTLGLFSAIDASDSLTEISTLSKLKDSSLKKLERRSLEAMQEGDVRGWKIQTFLQRFLSAELEITRPASFHTLGDGRETLMKDYVSAIIKSIDAPIMMMYLEALLGEYFAGSDTNGQLVAVQYVVDRLIEITDQAGRTDDFDLSAAHSELTRALPEAKTTTNAVLMAKILCSILERKPHSITQWNVENLLSAVAMISSAEESMLPFEWQCQLVDVIIKKHRVRIEGHYHILLSTLQPLLRNLVQLQKSGQDSKAKSFARLIQMICEPTVGAVSRTQSHSALDSATDMAKRSAGRHMHLVLMQYVKLQLEADIPRPTREALETAVNSIFSILPPEGRKILNDAMDASGRAILREMFKQYNKFGKWKGI